MKKKITTALIIFSTIIMAGIAIFSGTRLYKLRNTSISPVIPESQPVAQASNTSPCEVLAFSVSGPVSTPTSTPTPTIPAATSTSTPTPTTTQSQQGSSSAPSAQESEDAPTDSLIAQTSPTISQETLPSAGVGFPTILLSTTGIFIIFIAIIFAI